MLDSKRKASLQESLDAVEKNVEYINKIVTDLQDYARPLKPFAGKPIWKTLSRICFQEMVHHRASKSLSAWKTMPKGL